MTIYKVTGRLCSDWGLQLLRGSTTPEAIMEALS